jgi:hypothetical protein
MLLAARYGPMRPRVSAGLESERARNNEPCLFPWPRDRPYSSAPLKDLPISPAPGCRNPTASSEQVYRAAVWRLPGLISAAYGSRYVVLWTWRARSSDVAGACRQGRSGRLGGGIPAKAANPLREVRNPPGNWSRPGSIVERNARNPA